MSNSIPLSPVGQLRVTDQRIEQNGQQIIVTIIFTDQQGNRWEYRDRQSRSDLRLDYIG